MTGKWMVKNYDIKTRLKYFGIFYCCIFRYGGNVIFNEVQEILNIQSGDL